MLGGSVGSPIALKMRLMSSPLLDKGSLLKVNSARLRLLDILSPELWTDLIYEVGKNSTALTRSLGWRRRSLVANGNRP